MSSQDYDEIEKIFNGTWNYDRDENVEEFAKADELPEDLTKLAMLEKSLTIKRVGDSIEEISVMADKEYKAVLKLDETFDWTSLFLFCYERDSMLSLSDNIQADVVEAFNSISRYLHDLLNIDNPSFERMINATFKDGVLTQDVTPLKENEGKQHYVKMYVKDGELIAEMHLSDKPSMAAKRYYKKS